MKTHQLVPSISMIPLKRTIGEYLADDTNRVIIYVGPNRVSWTLSEDLLCDQVEFFKKAFQGSFKEGTTKTMELPEDDSKDFAKVVDWICIKKLTCKNCLNRKIVPRMCTGNTEPEHELQWCSLWVLADKFGMPDLAEAAIAKIKGCWAYSDLSISAEAVAFAWKNTSTISSLRKAFLAAARNNFFEDGMIKRYGSLGKSLSVNAEFSETLVHVIRLHISLPQAQCEISNCFLHAKVQVVASTAPQKLPAPAITIAQPTLPPANPFRPASVPSPSPHYSPQRGRGGPFIFGGGSGRGGS